MKTKKQKFLSHYSLSMFEDMLNKYLELGWTVVPETLYPPSGKITDWVVVIEREID